MEKAILEARKSSSGEFKIGAIVVYRNKIIGRGTPKDHITLNPVKHAEVVAIQKACKFLKTNLLHGCSIYVTAEPCLMCSSIIFQAKIPIIVFGAKRSLLPLRKRDVSIHDLVHDSGYNPEIVSGILEEKTLKVFNSKFKCCTKK